MDEFTSWRSWRCCLSASSCWSATAVMALAMEVGDDGSGGGNECETDINNIIIPIIQITIFANYVR